MNKNPIKQWAVIRNQHGRWIVHPCEPEGGIKFIGGVTGLSGAFTDYGKARTNAAKMNAIKDTKFVKP